MQRFTKIMVQLGVTALVALAAGSAQAEAPQYVRVRNISYAGSGCPAGSVAQNIASDLTAFTLLFDQYVAEAGPGVPFNQKRKNCQLNVDLDFPQGWSYTLVTVDYRGYLALERGTSAVQQSSYYFQGQAATARLTTTVRGPVERDYQIRDQLGLDATVWSPCGAQRSLNINTEVRADNAANSRGHALITTDSIDGQLKQIYGLRWARCH